MLLRVNNKASLAVAAMHALAGVERHNAVALAKAVGTTPAYLSQVLVPLLRAGWVPSSVGPGGG